MKIIGKADKFYTLWEVTENTKYDALGSFTQSVFTYIQNVSLSLEKVKELYPGVEIDESLRGTHSWMSNWKRSEMTLSPDCFAFGSHCGSRMEDVGENYLLWYFKSICWCFTENATEDWKAAHKEAAKRVLESYGYVVEGTESNSRVFKASDLREESETMRNFRANQTVSFLKNLNYEGCYGFIENVKVSFENFETCYYHGYEYGMAVVMNKKGLPVKKSLKNKTIKVLEYDLTEIPEIFNVDGNIYNSSFELNIKKFEIV